LESMLTRLSLYLHTLRWLQVSQLIWQVYRRMRPVVATPDVSAESCRQRIAATGFAAGPQPGQCELRFLNISSPAEPDHIDWHPADRSRLWRYNLHYFDYLHWDSIPEQYKAAYIESWIAVNPQGTADAWEPYTLSLRVVNWIKFFNTREHVPAVWQQSLINQVYWLQHNLEHHILANHYYKNAKALLFAGVWFKDERGAEFLQRGQRLFVEQTREQVLEDGGHYERSPMYHCIVLEDCLDVVNLMQGSPELFADEHVAVVSDAALRMLRFIDEVRGADGRIPLFNDAAFGIAAEPAELLDYGSRLLGYEPLASMAPPRQPAAVRYPQSGYYGYRYENDSLIIDCGAVGPDYQPGHTHCDMLSFELCIDGQRIVVDPGVHGYEDDETRHYLRSTAAHNTVTLDDAEQSEIWGTFRVARRAKPLKPHVSDFCEDKQTFSGGHDGFRRMPQRARHWRTVSSDLAGRWDIVDEVQGSGDGAVRSYLHFAPDLAVRPLAGQGFAVMRGDTIVARVLPDDSCETEIVKSYVAFEFGLRESAAGLRMLRRGKLPLRLSYRIERADYAAR
jgi:uncharacterized heparinase superfamily protein